MEDLLLYISFTIDSENNFDGKPRGQKIINYGIIQGNVKIISFLYDRTVRLKQEINGIIRSKEWCYIMKKIKALERCKNTFMIYFNNYGEILQKWLIM